MTYNVFGGTLNPAQSNPILTVAQSCDQKYSLVSFRGID